MQAVQLNHGHIMKTTGDVLHAVLEEAIDGLDATRAVQRALQSLGAFLRARMGLHTREAELRDGDV